MKEVYGNYNPESNKTADLHIHTNQSDGTLTPEQVVDLAHHLDLNAVAITDHDMIRPSEIAREYSAQKNLPLEIVVGSEITTSTNGKRAHLIGLFLTDEVEKHQTINDTVYAIHRQDGLAIVPHAEFLHFGFSSFTREDLEKYLITDDPEVYIDGFEVSNGGLLLTAKRKLSRGKTPPRAYEFALNYYSQNHDKLGAAIGGSDAHRITLALSLTGYEADLKQDIKDKKTSVIAPETYEEFTFQYQQAKELFANTPIQVGRSQHLF